MNHQRKRKGVSPEGLTIEPGITGLAAIVYASAFGLMICLALLITGVGWVGGSWRDGRTLRCNAGSSDCSDDGRSNRALIPRGPCMRLHQFQRKGLL